MGMILESISPNGSERVLYRGLGVESFINRLQLSVS